MGPLAALLFVLAAAAPADVPWQRHVIDGSSRGADGVKLADVDGDGRPDIATGWEEGGSIRLAMNPGPEHVREPWPTVEVGQVMSPEDALPVDLDGDSQLDVVSCCEGRNRTVYVHWAPTDPTRRMETTAWRTEPIPATANQMLWMFVRATDIDGRHGIDLVLGAKGNGAVIGWLEAPADPRRLADWRWHPLRDAGWVMSLELVDLDRDGRLDILSTDRKGPQRGLFWLRHPGATRPLNERWSEHAITSDEEPMFLALGRLRDTDADGVVVACRERLVYVGRPAPDTVWTTEVIALPGNVGTGKGVSVGDIDGDGSNDIVLSCENASGGKSGLVWLSRLGGGWKRHEVSGPAGIKYDLVELLDLDGDSDLDILTCEERENLGVIWYENPAR